MKKIILLLMVVLVLASCSTLRELSRYEKENLALANLRYLNGFKATGIAEIAIKGFSIKKEFVLSKNKSTLRLDILESGIMSLLPSPFATIYVADKVIITNYNKGFFNDLVLDQFPFSQYLDLEALPQGIIDEIVSNKAFNIAVLQFKFDDMFRLNKIIMNENIIDLNYEKKDLSLVNITSSKAKINISLDSFTPGEVKIKPLKLKN